MEFITLLLVEKKYFTVREQQKLIDVSINGICIEHYSAFNGQFKTGPRQINLSIIKYHL